MHSGRVSRGRVCRCWRWFHVTWRTYFYKVVMETLRTVRSQKHHINFFLTTCFTLYKHLKLPRSSLGHSRSHYTFFPHVYQMAKLSPTYMLLCPENACWLHNLSKQSETKISCLYLTLLLAQSTNSLTNIHLKTTSLSGWQSKILS